MAQRAQRRLAHERAEVGHPAPPDLLHDLLHLAELLDELVDLLDGRARALARSAAAASP